jgi:hypothetical protein
VTVALTKRIILRVLPSRSFPFFLTLLLLTLTSAAVSQKVDKLWSADLSKDQDFQKRLDGSAVNVRPPTLNFLTQNQIIIAFDDAAISVESEMKPIGFHVLEVDASSGRLGKRLSFKVLGDTSQAEPVADGDFLVLSGEQLKKFSSSFKELTSLPAPLERHGQPTDRKIGRGYSLDAHYETWQIHIAADGQEFALAHRKSPFEMEVSWLRTADFSLVGTAQGAPFNSQTLASPRREVWVYPRKWAKELMSSGELLPGCGDCRKAYFLTDDLVLVEGRNKYNIKTSSGETKASSKLKSDIFKFSTAAGSSRFAYATGGYRGSGLPLQSHFAPHMDVDVFDWGSMKKIHAASFDEPERPVSTGFKNSAIALSSDGRQLVILEGSTLSLYTLQ